MDEVWIKPLNQSELTYEPLDAVYLYGSLFSRRALSVSNLFGRVAEQNRALRDGRRLSRLIIV